MLNDKNSFERYSKAAEQGEAEAQFTLGWIYSEGKGMKQDKKQAFDWFSKAAEQGHPEAQFNLGTMYYTGEGVKEDLKKALDWCLKAAEQGDAFAMAFLEKSDLRLPKGIINTIKKRIGNNKTI